MRQYFFLLACLFLVLRRSPVESAPDSLRSPEAARYRRIVGLNMTPLVTQLVPFNRSSPDAAGPFLLRFKRYGSQNKTAFRFSLGVHLTPDDDGEFEEPQINGWEKRRSMSKHWGYTRGLRFWAAT